MKTGPKWAAVVTPKEWEHVIDSCHPGPVTFLEFVARAWGRHGRECKRCQSILAKVFKDLEQVPVEPGTSDGGKPSVKTE